MRRNMQSSKLKLNEINQNETEQKRQHQYIIADLACLGGYVRLRTDESRREEALTRALNKSIEIKIDTDGKIRSYYKIKKHTRIIDGIIKSNNERYQTEKYQFDSLEEAKTVLKEPYIGGNYGEYLNDYELILKISNKDNEIEEIYALKLLNIKTSKGLFSYSFDASFSELESIDMTHIFIQNFGGDNDSTKNKDCFNMFILSKIFPLWNVVYNQNAWDFEKIIKEKDSEQVIKIKNDLLSAADQCDLAKVKELLLVVKENKIDINTIRNSRNETLLMLAASGTRKIPDGQSHETVKLLLAHGADPLAISRDKRTALMEASNFGRLSVVTLLIENVPLSQKLTYINQPDDVGSTARTYAKMHGHDKVITTLTEKTEEAKKALESTKSSKFTAT